jgi:hypothetical protein
MCRRPSLPPRTFARACVKIALGYLRDVDAELDASQPVYIVELGAGSGRFGYRFVKRLSFLLERSSITHSHSRTS